MTAPTIVSSRRGAGLPTWSVDTLKVVGASHTDSLGRRWTVASYPDGEKGWSNPPAPRTNRDDRVNQDGSFRSTSYRKERTIVLSGSVWCPTPALREQTEIELSAVCAPGRDLYEYRRTTDSYDQVAMVELDDEPIIDVVTLHRVDWSFQFCAPDPRKHDYRWQEPRGDPPQPGAPGGGLDDSGGGLSDAGGGLDDSAGTGTQARPAVVANYGTASAAPFLILTGPLPASPLITRMETGETLGYGAAVATGETVSINCDEFPARGVPAQTAISSTNGDVTSLLTVGTSWPLVAAQDVASFILSGAGPVESLTAALRSAYR